MEGRRNPQGEEEKEQMVGTHEDYFGMRSMTFSELESHHESLHDFPQTDASAILFNEPLNSVKAKNILIINFYY